MTPAKMRAYEQAFPKAAAGALNKMAAQSKTESSRLVRERYNVKKSDLDPAFTIRRATSSSLQSVVKAKGRRISLIHFGARGTIPPRRGTVGVTVEVIRGRRLAVAGSFLVAMKSSRARGIFVRKGQPRFPIQKLTGPSIPQMFYATKVYGNLVRFVDTHLPKLLADAIKFRQA